MRWVLDPTLSVGKRRTRVGARPLAELLGAESEIMNAVLPHDVWLYRPQAFSGRNIALAHVIVVVEANGPHLVRFRLVDGASNRVLVFVSGETGADLFPPTAGIVSLGLSDAAATMGQPAPAGTASQVCHSERALFHVLDAATVEAIAQRALDVCLPAERQSRATPISGALHTAGVTAIVLDLASTRTMCSGCQGAATAWQAQIDGARAGWAPALRSATVYVRAIAEAWFQGALRAACTRAAAEPGPRDRFVHTHYDCYAETEADAITREELHPVTIRQVPAGTRVWGTPPEGREAVLIPASPRSRQDFARLLTIRGTPQANRIISLLTAQVLERKDDLASRKIALEAMEVEYGESDDDESDPDYDPASAASALEDTDERDYEDFVAIRAPSTPFPVRLASIPEDAMDCEDGATEDGDDDAEMDDAEMMD